MNILLKKGINNTFFLFGVVFIVTCMGCSSQKLASTKPIIALEKQKDVIIYQDSMFHSAFPSVIKRENGNYMVAFRRAPERKIFGEKGSNHVDPNSYLMTVESKDGENWTQSPKLLYAHPFGGSQDPCLLQLKNGTIICASYGWAFLRETTTAALPVSSNSGATFLGGYVVRSTDNGETWSDAIYPPNIVNETRYNAMGKPLPAYNRGAMLEGANGNVYWVVAVGDANGKTSNHLLISKDDGLSWDYSAVVAEDSVASFNETSIYETPKGDLVAFMRTSGMEDQGCIARSKDGGKTFEWQSMGFKGHPYQAMRLPDDQVLLVYGYRHAPMGIRARILNAECTNFETAEEFVIRDDGGGKDLGYPWAIMMDDDQVLVTYYFNIKASTRHIAGSILSLKRE